MNPFSTPRHFVQQCNMVLSQHVYYGRAIMHLPSVHVVCINTTLISYNLNTLILILTDVHRHSPLAILPLRYRFWAQMLLLHRPPLACMFHHRVVAGSPTYLCNPSRSQLRLRQTVSPQLSWHPLIRASSLRCKQITFRLASLSLHNDFRHGRPLRVGPVRHFQGTPS